jgi:putative transposase
MDGASAIDQPELHERRSARQRNLRSRIGTALPGRCALLPVALSDGFRESTESWAELLRDCRRRGMAAPTLAVGDGALGFWKSVRELFPPTREQRRLSDEHTNVLAALAKSADPGAVAAMSEIYKAQDIGRHIYPQQPVPPLTSAWSWSQSSLQNAS